jgi:hypothetical protein
VKLGTVRKSYRIYFKAPENPGKSQLGDRMKGMQSSLQKEPFFTK